MTQSTVSVNRDSIALGLAKLYLGDSSTHLSTTIPVLSESSYLGAKTSVSLSVSRSFKKRFKILNDIKVLMDTILTSSSISISISFIEITEQNLSYAFGGSASLSNILSDLINTPVEHRAELIFTYPNNINKMTLILPRVKITTNSVDMGFNPENPLETPIALSTLCTEDSNWIGNEYGKIIFT